MSRMEGRPLCDVWATLTAEAQRPLLREVGGALAALHRLDAPSLGDSEPRWETVAGIGREPWTARQRTRGLPEPWLDAGWVHLSAWLPAFASAPLVLEHADVTWENVFVADRGGTWHVVALLDFADAMHAPVEYEFAAPASHLLVGRPDLRRAFLDGYGYRAPPDRPPLADLVLATALAHRFVALGQTAESFCSPPRPASLADLGAMLVPPGIVAGGAPEWNRGRGASRDPGRDPGPPTSFAS